MAQFVLLLLTLRVATSLLSPFEMGKISIVTATVAFFALLLLNPVGMFMNRRMHAWDARGQVKQYFAYFWKYLVAVSISAGLILAGLVWWGIWTPSIGIDWLLALVCGNLLFATVGQVVIPGLNMFGHRGWFTVLTVVMAAMSLIFAVALTVTISARAEYWLSGLLIGQLIVGLIGMKIFFGKLHHADIGCPPPQLSHLHLKHLMRFVWPVALAVGLGWIQSQGYRYIMESRIGLVELGLFVAGFGISSGLIAGFESMFSAYFQPKFYRRVSKDSLSEQSQAWIEYAQNILPALFLTSVFIMATAPELTKLLLGSNFKQSSEFVIWGAFAELARVSTVVYGLAAQARMNTKLLLLPNFLSAVTAVLLVWFLTPLYGSDGVGFSLVSSALIALLATAYVNKKYLAITLPLNHFWKSAVMGGGLLLLATVLRLSMGNDGSYFMAIAMLFMVGSVFMLFQFVMLLPVLKAEAIIPHNPDKN